ncbi:hypothetical protein C1H69_21275 [Billgrantia endophytica]|uniref:DUF5666 domain-containing protein n=2 Tax=Billgrantia endophytica TaxID=2033802 RepID=A0A2N7TWF5_9GAMM|nr:hypothetical protein C1H69_21275 [Halomonas endophytica]
MAAAAIAGVSISVSADDIEGVIEAVDAENRTLTVQGITFEVTDSTDYDDGLSRFEDLQEGQRVEVDFDYRDGRHIATEIELED